MKTKKRRWKGELRKAIYVGSIPIETTSEESENEESEWIEQVIQQEMIEKLPLLMEHYKIADKDDYFSLALLLARDHVPGFQVVSTKLKLKHGDWGAVIRATKPIKWSSERLLRLPDAVEAAKQKYGFSTDREALDRAVMREREWRQPPDHRGERKQWLETLESRLHDAKRIKRAERRGPALDRDSAAILYELQKAVRRVTANKSAATAYATLPMELRFAALCLPFL